MIGFKFDGIPVSFVCSSLENTQDVFSDHVIEGSKVRLAKPEAILQGKIVGRLIKSKNPTDRDGYDIAFALEQHQQVFRRAISNLSDFSHETLLDIVRSAGGLTGRGRPLLNASRPDIATDPWGKVLTELERILPKD